MSKNYNVVCFFCIIAAVICLLLMCIHKRDFSFSFLQLPPASYPLDIDANPIQWFGKEGLGLTTKLVSSSSS